MFEVILNLNRDPFHIHGYTKCIINLISLQFQLVLALRYLHKEKKIVHRDLTPNNIMLGENDKVTISKSICIPHFTQTYEVMSHFSCLCYLCYLTSASCVDIQSHKQEGCEDMLPCIDCTHRKSLSSMWCYHRYLDKVKDILCLVGECADLINLGYYVFS